MLAAGVFAGAINTTAEAVDDPFLFLDLTATARITDTLDMLASSPSRLAQLAAAAVARGRPDAAETIARRILTLLDVKQIRS